MHFLKWRRKTDHLHLVDELSIEPDSLFLIFPYPQSILLQIKRFKQLFYELIFYIKWPMIF